LRWGSKRQRKFSGKIHIQDFKNIKDIIVEINTYPKSKNLAKIKFLQPNISFESDISNNSAGLDLKFAESHPAVSIIFELRLDDEMKIERAFIPGKGLTSITHPLVLRKAER
jgi:hypothetical protein